MSESRLYALENDEDETELSEGGSSSFVTLGLAAMLPLAANWCSRVFLFPHEPGFQDPVGKLGKSLKTYLLNNSGLAV